MWNYLKKDYNISLLNELGTIEIASATNTYLFKKEIGKVGLTILDPNSAYDIFSATTTLKIGEILIFLKKDELNAILTLEYRVHINPSTFSNTNFTKIYSEVKEDIHYLNVLYAAYIDYVKKTISKQSKKESKTNPFDSSKFADSVENILNNLKTTEEDNHEN